MAAKSQKKTAKGRCLFFLIEPNDNNKNSSRRQRGTKNDQDGRKVRTSQQNRVPVGRAGFRMQTHQRQRPETQSTHQLLERGGPQELDKKGLRQVSGTRKARHLLPARDEMQRGQAARGGETAEGVPAVLVLQRQGGVRGCGPPHA